MKNNYQTYDVEKTSIKVGYCISNEVRDRQLMGALARHLPALRDVGEPKKDVPCAVVAFGPSLNETWVDARRHPVIFTCSGSHKFLLERGVKPSDFQAWYHVECDPRAHKLDLLGTPQKGVQYLVTSVSHPRLLDALEGFDVKLWHVYDGTKLRELPAIYPRGELVVTGGSNVGLRAMTLARVLGYTDLHIYGMDYSFPKPDGKLRQHAAKHPNSNKNVVTAKIGNRTFYTTPVMVFYAREFWHEIEQLVDTRFTLNGDGLLQAWGTQRIMAREDIKVQNQAVIATKAPDLISTAYREQNRLMHQKVLEFGDRGAKLAPVVSKMRTVAKCDSVLDYGCGKGALARALPYPIWEYDPAIPGKDKDPRPADLVVCSDVLEHIEPEYLEVVLGDLQRVTLKVVYFIISTRPAQKTLPDGRNTHLIVKDKEWWVSTLRRYFEIPSNGVSERPEGLHIIAGPLPVAKRKAA